MISAVQGCIAPLEIIDYQNQFNIDGLGFDIVLIALPCILLAFTSPSSLGASPYSLGPALYYSIVAGVAIQGVALIAVRSHYRFNRPDLFAAQEEIARHNQPNDAWIVYLNQIYQFNNLPLDPEDPQKNAFKKELLRHAGQTVSCDEMRRLQCKCKQAFATTLEEQCQLSDLHEFIKSFS